MDSIISILLSIVEIFDNGIKAFEPYQGSVSMDEKQYTAMQGIIHFIGWTVAIGIIIWVFRYMKKHSQQDERMKKYYSEEDKKQSE
ncbi:hypothetical protein SAMN06265182_0316 [Persephonella hydrogeniphila]|uniref:Uncharacterized protein n=1 Tax=Persephonella hydrogeniphila TaxID=198703 RepID=A0A285N1I2_9AQUI|nr:hypothetical protein [Persephonella hydrogeniphila]SNZ03188.1 hypothetical protein SAMN06265182_0316 [Persephonella hydrogeniphila]